MDVLRGLDEFWGDVWVDYVGEPNIAVWDNVDVISFYFLAGV
jgi:hypothetical protein